MRQVVKIKLKRADAMYVDNSEDVQQRIMGKGTLTVLLNPFTARLIANEEVELADVDITDVIRSGAKFNELPMSELVKYVGDAGKMPSMEKVVKLAEEKYRKVSSEEVDNVAK